MREKLPQHPIIRKDRPDYGAVPLEPWTAVEERRHWLRKKRETYLASSVLRINSRIDATLGVADEYHWVEDPELALDLRNLIETSLYDSHRRRMEMNPGVLDYGMVDETDERVEKARNGTASPIELLGLLIDYPKLGSLELAKLSHPLDSEAPAEMNSEVLYALACKQFTFVDSEGGRYKTKTMRPGIPAATILRKQTIAELELPDGLLQVVQRKAFLVRGDEEARAENDVHLDRIVRNPDRHDELFEKVEGIYRYSGRLPAGFDRSRKWLQPLASSYYAKYVDSPEPKDLDVPVSAGESLQ